MKTKTNKKVVASMIVIVMALLAITGGTLAWFSDSDDIEQNVFTAGTVILEAYDSWAETGHEVENWNPGDCDDKEISLEYLGSKNAFLRMKITEEWSDTDGVDGVWNDRDVPNVDWKVNGTDWADQTDWVYYDGWWYYTGGEGDYCMEINGTTIKSFAPGQAPGVIGILTEVCLDGPGTGNEYQGAKYTIDAEFEALQGSNNASGDAWGITSGLCP